MLDELEGAESRAQQAEARTRAFLADAAHELRTPIAGVQAAAETLLHAGDQLGAAEREQLEVLLVREALRAGKLVSDLLQTARLDAGVQPARAPVALRGLVLAEVERARLLSPQVRNLIDNALRAVGASGAVGVHLDQQEGLATVEVTDSGPGVPAAERERIFDRLVRLDQSRSADRGGAGLGLAIARGYARAHGGELTCEPVETGALFRLTLPQHPAATESLPTGA
jgi:signal transduction histidine kinase